jgi:hypothetical protein
VLPSSPLTPAENVTPFSHHDRIVCLSDYLKDRRRLCVVVHEGVSMLPIMRTVSAESICVCASSAEMVRRCVVLPPCDAC